MDENAAPEPPPRKPDRRRVALAAAVAVVVVAVVAGVIVAIVRSQSSPTHHVAAKSTPIPTITSSAPAPTPTPSSSTPAPAPKPAKPTVPHDVVVAAAPTSFQIKGPKFDIKAHVCGMANIRPLDPPGEQHHTVCWVQEGFGVAPGSDSGTTYVLGHSWGQDDLEVLNQLSALATREILALKSHDSVHMVSGVPTYPVKGLNGYILTLWTPKGTLHYTVRSAYGVPKEQAASVAPLMNQSTKNRIVIITCAERNHVDYDYNVIVDAYLTSSVKATAHA